jgi:hypothetical protein
MVSISSAGITPRIVRSIAAIRFSLSSSRVPGAPRTWSLMRPASTVGKKSRPTSEIKDSEPAISSVNATTTNARCCSAHARPRPYPARSRENPRSNATVNLFGPADSRFSR